MGHVAFDPSSSIPARRVILARIIAVCKKVGGHVDLAPCRLCTAYAPRSQLGGGLLPEETHRDPESLKQFFAVEKKRRGDRKQHLKQEMQQLRQEATDAIAFSAVPKATTSIRKKPAAAVTPKRYSAKKRPAAAEGRRDRTAKVAKKPSRA